MHTVAIIGAGNVSQSLAPALKKAGFNIVQVYSRTYEHAEDLAEKVGAKPAFSISDLQADYYIITVPDSNIEEVASYLPNTNSVVLHTSGSTHIDILKPYCDNYGVLYPMQTFSKSKPVEFESIPVFIEANSPAAMEKVKSLADKLTTKVAELNSEKRMGLHISAVFSCNFFNNMLASAFDICNKHGIDMQTLRPLVEETLNKAFDTGNPYKVQTGPAVRGDQITIAKHLELLKDNPELQKIYELISAHIYHMHHSY